MDNNNTPNPEEHGLTSKGAISIVLFVVVIVSVSGFFMEMRHSSQDDVGNRIWLDLEVVDDSNVVVPSDRTAPTYQNIPSDLFKNNAQWVNHLNKLTRVSHNHHEMPVLTKEEREEAVMRRQSRRAYDGAPPVIPHAISTRDTQSCVSCHSPGRPVLMAGKVSPVMSHEYLPNCIQCHAPSVKKDFMTHEAMYGLSVENVFGGKSSAGKGERAFAQAPPVMPHPVHMRQNCMACHGEGRANAIQTSHPQRQNCMQCHAVHSGFDNRERFELKQQ
ncbi:hypothetical protein [Rubritalea marina]|uniref:hypothetical protein n=1 Tax=Rubritalea marina TaxID=361055 RepID=UPI00037AD0A3|nr:hypothetical protein [Rubritalea marina]